VTIIDPGHSYLMDQLDSQEKARIDFVKREGVKYPGNVGHHPGIIVQENLRVLIDRLEYVNNQIWYPENDIVIDNLRMNIWLLESRAKKTRKEFLDASRFCIEKLNTCRTCGHILCSKHPQG
jgi:hypothetical protein